MKRVVVALAVLSACGFDVTSGAAPGDGASRDARSDDDPVIDAAPDAPVERVTQNLLALYTFSEGSGTVVTDQSGVSPPLDLVISEPGRVQWGTGTLTITQANTIASEEPASKLVAGCRDADAFTLEAWIIPGAIDGATLGRVATLSSSNSSLAVTLMALGSHYEFRMYGPMTDTNGLPSLNTANDTHVVGTLRHVVLVSAPSGDRRVYLDGMQVAADQLGGDLAIWGTAAHRFALGNELDGNRVWRGTYDLVAVYARALTLTEVQQNFAAGPK